MPLLAENNGVQYDRPFRSFGSIDSAIDCDMLSIFMMEWDMPRKIYGVTAQQTTKTSGSPERLTVKAVVQTLNSGEKLSLLEAPPSNKPQVGVLTLEVQVETGTGADVLGSTTVEFVNRTFENQFDKVTVITDNNSSTVNIQTI